MSEGRGFADDTPPPIPRAVPAAPMPAERGWVEGQAGAAEAIRHAPLGTLEAPAARPGGPLLLAAGALLALLAGWAGLSLANFIAAQFARAAWLGWASLLLLLPPLLLLALAVAREARGFRALREVDGLRRELAGHDPAHARAAALRWVGALPEGEAAASLLRGAEDVPTLHALLGASVLPRLDRQVAAAGRAAALQTLAATAVSPWPGLDGVIIVLRGMRLVREVAQIHGLRPGALGTARLFLRVTLDAGLVSATEVVATELTEALFQSPLAGGLVGQGSGAALAARRMLRLAVAVSRACRPL